MEPVTRRSALGLLAAAGLATTVKKPARRRALAEAPGPYGSGVLAWPTSGPASVSTNAAFASANLWWFGDSISYRDQFDLLPKLTAKGYVTAVNDWSGRPTTPTVDALETLLGSVAPPPKLVMAVGTNDIFDPTPMAAQIDRVMGLLPASTQVFWMDVQCCRVAGTFQVADQRNTGWVNDQIHDGVGRHSNLSLIPWFSWFASAPSREAAYLVDGVHTNTTNGAAFRSAAILEAL